MAAILVTQRKEPEQIANGLQSGILQEPRAAFADPFEELDRCSEGDRRHGAILEQLYSFTAARLHRGDALP
jgi:hypothetical protein